MTGMTGMTGPTGPTGPTGVVGSEGPQGPVDDTVTGPTGPGALSPAFLTTSLQGSSTGSFTGLYDGGTGRAVITITDIIAVNGRPLLQGFVPTTAGSFQGIVQGYRVLYGTAWTVTVDLYVIGWRGQPQPYTVDYTCYYATVDYDV